MKKIFTLFLLTSCGEIQHKHEGEIVHKVIVDLETIENYFNEVCDFDKNCKDDYMKDFLLFMTGNK